MAGYAIGFLAAFPLASMGGNVSGLTTIGLAVCGMIVGGGVGSLLQGPEGRARTVARWCTRMTVVVGVVSFLIGFVGPIIFDPHSPQGPLLGIFFTGPLGAIAGAVAGTIIGLLVPVVPTS